MIIALCTERFSLSEGLLSYFPVEKLSGKPVNHHRYQRPKEQERETRLTRSS
jgi:hypothetical protein